jgi:hypothetical protein
MTVALGAAPAALAILTSTIKALKAMAPNSSWISIFSRESQKARLARFQIGIVDRDKDGDVFVSLLACLVVSVNWWKSNWHQPSTSEQLTMQLLTPPPFVN